MSVLFGRGKHNDRFIESGHGNGRTRVKPGSAKFDIVAGSGITFEDFGIHVLKGVPDDWQLYREAGRSGPRGRCV